MKRALRALLVIAPALLVHAPVAAHHSYGAIYFEDRVQRIEGNLVQFLFRNPHSFVHVDVVDKTGAIHRYAIEWGGGLRLTQQGVTPLTLHAGDHVIIEGNPGRDPEEYRMRMRRITRPSDGWSWSGFFQ